VATGRTTGEKSVRDRLDRRRQMESHSGLSTEVVEVNQSLTASSPGTITRVRGSLPR